MKSSCKTSCAWRRGLTLLEVLAGLVLMGTLLVAIMAARQRFMHQWTLANQRIKAVAEADKLVSLWWQTPAKFPREGQGLIEDTDGWTWQIHPQSNAQIQSVGGQVVRVEVWQRQPAASDVPLAFVDVVLPQPEASR